MLINKYLSNTSKNQVLIISTVQYLITLAIFSILIIEDEHRVYWWINSITMGAINFALVMMKIMITLSSKHCFKKPDKISLIYFNIMELLFYAFIIFGSLMCHYQLNAYFFTISLSWLTNDGKASLLVLAFMILWSVFFTMLTTFIVIVAYVLTNLILKGIYKREMLYSIKVSLLTIHSVRLIIVFLLTILVYFFSWITYLYMVPVIITVCSLLGGINYYVFDRVIDKPFLYKRP